MADQWAAPDTGQDGEDAVPGAPPEGAALRRAFEAPANVVLVVCQMLAGLGLALALIVKVYMLVFTDLICTGDAATLGDMIRCTPTLTLMAQVIMLAAGLRLAACLFSDVTARLIEPLAIGLAGALLAMVAAVLQSGTPGADPATVASMWQAAILILTLLGAGTVAFAGLRLTGRL